MLAIITKMTLTQVRKVTDSGDISQFYVLFLSLMIQSWLGLLDIKTSFDDLIHVVCDNNATLERMLIQWVTFKVMRLQITRRKKKQIK